MSRVWGLVLVLVLALAFSLNAVSVKAEVPDVIILPSDRIISVNSNVVIKADPKTSEAPIRVTWSVYNTGSIGLGSFPLSDGKWLCYFSNTDGNATCGPSPFFNTGETEFYVYVVTPTKNYNKTVFVNISSFAIPVDGINRVDNTVYMYLIMGKKDMMKYSIYKEDLSIYQSERPLDYSLVEGRYWGNITLNPGVYYFTFFVNDSGNYGSALKRIEIPSGDFLTVKTSKSEYWKGEKVRLSGTTNAGLVSGEVRFPDGSKAFDFSADVAADRTFSYEFNSQSNWPEGNYEIRTSKPLAKTATFSVIEFFELVPEAVSETVNKSEAFTASIHLKNLRTNATNITLSVDGDLEEEYVTIADSYLSPQATTTIDIEIPEVESKIEGSIKLKTTEGLELSIPVSIAIREAGQQCTAANAMEIDTYSLIWSQECMADEEIYHTVKISNKGTKAMSDFIYVIDDTFTGELETLDQTGNIDVPVQGLSIAPDEYEEIDIRVTPLAGGKYQGVMTFKSGSDSASIFISLNCFENISGSLSELSGKLETLNPSADIKDGISSDISNAENSLSLGNYEQANEFYNQAKAKVDLLETGGVSQPVDLTMPIIMIVIIVVVVVFLWFFKFRRPRVSGLEEEEELESF